ncbi:hypothetical protein HMPREF0293_0802 [Corynebacterium glucuronolyticum ATCC 51866]|uniref:Uncharacterized protein n=1 Tax=Corynebacterium glucuronolyticum ATCC 51866 TaxID=548478 RepID=A0ABM9XRE2_9CORY|nr:hypothetical protein HMPREF0293_0802 [Corynebacterium glucuronolyticum ATCC 51866]
MKFPSQNSGLTKSKQSVDTTYKKSLDSESKNYWDITNIT